MGESEDINRPFDTRFTLAVIKTVLMSANISGKYGKIAIR